MSEPLGLRIGTRTLKTSTLQRAAFDGDTSTVASMLDAAAPRATESEIIDALHAAIENHQLPCVQLLLPHVPLAGGDDRDLLEHAVDAAIDGTIQGGGAPGDEPTDVIAALVSAGARVERGVALAKRYGSIAVIEVIQRTAGIRGPYR